MRECSKKNISSSGSSASNYLNEYENAENYIDKVLDENMFIGKDAPNYVAEYDYENVYNNTPLVYSFFPLVPAFAQKILGGGENKIKESLNNSEGSISSIDSFVVSNQDNKLKKYLEFKEHKKSPQKIETEKLQICDASTFYQLDNSCNAVDINISRKEPEKVDTALSFDGKIRYLTIDSIDLSGEEKERLHNDSLKMLSKEDSSKMLFLNEKSPDLFEKKIFNNSSNNNTSEKTDGHILQILHISDNKTDTREVNILNKLNASMSGICPPPSITRFQMSLHDMLSSYKKNIAESIIIHEESQSGSFFKPSNSMEEVLKMEWPCVIRTNFHDIAYNKSTISEEIEVTCLRYCERFIGSETSSSFNNEVSSAKKRNDRLKLLQSPGKRLSHLAKRRSIFSSANLKSNCLNGSQPTSIPSRLILIDKTKKMFHQKSSTTNSPQKIFSFHQQMSKKKTPKSKDHSSEIIEKLTLIRETSKRALFKSPLEILSNNINHKRKRSESVESLSCDSKFRRLDNSSQNENHRKSSIPSTHNDGHVKKRLFSGTNSDDLPHSSTKKSVKQPMTTDIKRKLLWATSQSLASKQISKDHRNFKEYATLLVKLTKRLFTEFFCPNKSVSGQMLKFSNSMVFFVIQGRHFDDIYSMTKSRLQKSLCQKELSSLTHSRYEDNKQNEIRKTNSVLSSTFPSFKTKNNVLSSEKCINSSSSKNNESFVLRENVIRCNQKSSTKKTTMENTKLLSKVGSSSNLQRAKRQISF